MKNICKIRKFMILYKIDIYKLRTIVAFPTETIIGKIKNEFSKLSKSKICRK